MKPDERKLFELMVAENKRPLAQRRWADAIAAAIGMHPKRANYLLEKWDSKRWWESGVSVRTGWVTDEGFAAAERLGLNNGEVISEELCPARVYKEPSWMTDTSFNGIIARLVSQRIARNLEQKLMYGTGTR